MPIAAAVLDLLLVRRGKVFAPPADRAPDAALARAAALEFSALGYLPTQALSDALARLSPDTLQALVRASTAALSKHLGADRPHEPLFRHFPQDIPADTAALWWDRVVVTFLQQPEQPCVLCGRAGTIHVLRPCAHLACASCFDGSNYAGCPICHRHVDRNSPFFTSADLPPKATPREAVRWRLLELGTDPEGEARQLFEAICARRQALSPADKDALVTLLQAFGERALAWVPPVIPVKENVAIVFGTLLRERGVAPVLPRAIPHLKTATDVLRLLAAYSNVDPTLVPQLVFRRVERPDPRHPLWKRIAATFGATLGPPPMRSVAVPIQVRRFKVAKLSRPLRKALLAVLDGFEPDALAEDLLRHRSYWVWLGEFLHPHEYATRFPNVARAFAIVRRKAPDGTPAPAFRTWASRVEGALAKGDVGTVVSLLSKRPGELGRRFDHALRTAHRAAPGDPDAARPVLDAFVAAAPKLSNAVLLTLHALLPTRTRPAPVRVFFPKTQLCLAPSAEDLRPTISADAVGAAVRAIEAELLTRFAAKSSFDTAVIDTALTRITAPFNERTASRAAVTLTRGSRVPLPPSKHVRLFLHWCEPAGGSRTDLDLSIGLYDKDWKLAGVCSYYSLQVRDAQGGAVATSSGDRTSAPFPDGASEFVDLDRERARAAGFRHAVMVVNAFSGMPFSSLEHAFAGLMLRDDPSGAHFDPRTVRLKFALDGANGVFLPLAVDLETNELHWLDVYSHGEFEFNNVATSNRAITSVVPALERYFASDVRASVFGLALLHAAARTRRVILRDATGSQAWELGPGEARTAFLKRLQTREGGRPVGPDLPDQPIFAALHDGDVDLPPGSAAYVLFPERITGNTTGSDLAS